MKYEGKNIGILGLGKSGYWSAKLAKSLNNNVFVSDSNENVNQIFIDDLKMLGVELEIGDQGMFYAGTRDLHIPSTLQKTYLLGYLAERDYSKPKSKEVELLFYIHQF